MESKLYFVTEIEEKELGCVAIKEIKRGTLILREKPCLLQNPDLEELDKHYQQVDDDNEENSSKVVNCVAGFEPKRLEVQVVRFFLREFEDSVKE